MKPLITKLTIVGLLIIAAVWSAGAQAHTEIEFDSDVGANSPQLLLVETENGAADGWARMWFKNSADPDSRWAFLARPATGRMDNDGILNRPLIMAFNGVQKFGVDSSGTVRINKAYTLPTTDGLVGQVLSTDSSEEAKWSYLSILQDADEDTKLEINEGVDDGITIQVDNVPVAEVTKAEFQVRQRLTSRKTGTFVDPNIQIHHPNDAPAWLTFSNGGFANNRFAISADPSNTGGDPATMSFYWGSTGNPGGATKFITLNASSSDVEIAQNTTVEGHINIDEFIKLEPLVVPPTCAANGANNGTVYFANVPLNKRLRVCVDGTWEDLH